MVRPDAAHAQAGRRIGAGRSAHVRLLVAATTLVWLAQAARGPVVIGPQRHAVTAEDLAAIGEVVGRDRSIWIVEVGPLADTLAATVYLAPDRSSPELRRGRWLQVTKGSAGPDSPPRPWISVDEGSWSRGAYAQVPLAGRDPDDVRDEVDESRPFVVWSEVSDEDLLAVVRLARSATAERDPIVQIGLNAVSAVPGLPENWVMFKTRRQPQCDRVLSLRRQGRGWVSTGSSGTCP